MYTLSVGPQAHRYFPLLIGVETDTIHFVVLPATDVPTTVRPPIDPLTMLVIMFKIPGILATVRPSDDALAVLFIIYPVAFVLLSFRTGVLAMTVNIIVLKLALVAAAVFPNIGTSPMHLMADPVSIVYRLVFHIEIAAPAMVLVVHPPAFVEGTVGGKIATASFASFCFG